MAKPLTWAKRPKGDLCRNAALVPILHSMYSGMRFDGGPLFSMDLNDVRHTWAEMAYMVAEWCKEDRIRISNVYSLVPSYFGEDSVEGLEFVIGLDLMCGEIVDLGRVIEVIAHEQSLDMITYNGMVSVIIPRSDTGLDLATQIKMCRRRFGITDCLPPLRSTETSAEIVRVYSESAFVYNVDGRPMTARGLADELGCREDDVPDVLNTTEGRRLLDVVSMLSFRDSGSEISREEAAVYNFAEARTRRVAQRLGIPRSQVRVAPRFEPIRIKNPLASPWAYRVLPCEGVARSLAVWSVRFGIPIRRLVETWRPHITEEEWVELADSDMVRENGDDGSFRLFRRQDDGGY